ncbi:MAG: ornithine carbamoyltransferase [Candidatus Nanohaloarchaea archaeon]|nr:ornithine carbamoyltransferase [Candidatus Nanohaloarchaea archaeon]
MDNLIDIADLTTDDVKDVFERTDELRYNRKQYADRLANRTLLMLFEKPSTRTRVSFEAGMTQLGGHAINFEMESSQMSRGETLGDTAKVLSRYCDAVMARLYEHRKMKEFRDHADIPVINGLTDLLHPCQALGDLYTLKKEGLSFDELEMTYVGDGNNVCQSLLQVCGKLGVDMTVGSPEGYKPDEKIVGRARADADRKDARIRVVDDPVEAVDGADAVYTDVWTSMGDENREERREALQPFQVNEELLEHAAGNVRVMHCLPAHRGEEVTSAVLDGGHSIVFDQAENRLHVQKAVLDLLIN